MAAAHRQRPERSAWPATPIPAGLARRSSGSHTEAVSRRVLRCGLQPGFKILRNTGEFTVRTRQPHLSKTSAANNRWFRGQEIQAGDRADIKRTVG